MEHVVLVLGQAALVLAGLFACLMLLYLVVTALCLVARQARKMRDLNGP